MSRSIAVPLSSRLDDLRQGRAVSRADSPLRERLIFNVGARRSGTFWLQRIVSAHPDVAAVPSETHLFSHGIAPLFERFHHGDPDSPQVGSMYIDRERLLDATRDFCDAAFETFRGDHECVAERTPLHALHVDLISDIYPDSRIVHIIRDGRDAVRSLMTQRWGPGSIAAAAEEWRASVSAARDAGIDAHRYREVRYEEMLDAPEKTIAAIYGWLGLRTTDETLERGLAEARARANVGPRTGVGTRKWEPEWGERELAEFERVAGGLLRELGYAE
jgi:Sulfotransferase family